MIKRKLITLTVGIFILLLPMITLFASFKIVDATDVYLVGNSSKEGEYEFPSINDIFKDLFANNELKTTENNKDIENNLENENSNQAENNVNENIIQTDILIKAETNVNIRAGTGVEYVVVGRMDKGDLLPYKKTSGGFYETFYKGKKAYVSTSYSSLISIEKGTEKAEQVIEFGKTLLGYPYVWGATRVHDGKGNLLTGFKSNQFDCSSFTQYIYYKSVNINIGVTTRTQIYNGKEISKSNIKRGDLLFFTNASRKNNSGIERIGHVAIYLGDNYILHTASDYSVIEEISSTRWSYYIGARRVI